MSDITQADLELIAANVYHRRSTPPDLVDRLLKDRDEWIKRAFARQAETETPGEP